jgi:pectate lyase
MFPPEKFSSRTNGLTMRKLRHGIVFSTVTISFVAVPLCLLGCGSESGSGAMPATGLDGTSAAPPSATPGGSSAQSSTSTEGDVMSGTGIAMAGTDGDSTERLIDPPLLPGVTTPEQGAPSGSDVGQGGAGEVIDPEPDEIIGFGRNATGGAGGREVVVATASDLVAAAVSPEPLIITVQGAIVHDVSGGDDNARIFVTSNKTIQGADSNASVDANFYIREASNIIFRNLNLMNPEGKGTGDAIEFTESSSDIWVDHVTFHQSLDGSLDFKRGSDNITVSWCKFAYTSATHDHNYANLIGHTDTATDDLGKLKVTMHHNWYAQNVIERMPRVRYGQVHVFNNYYSSERTNYVIGLGVEAQILLEGSYFENQGDQTWFNWYEPNKCVTPCADGKIQWTDDNVFDQTTMSTWAPNSDVFDPPYPYEHVLQSAADARQSVMERAGVLTR